MLLRLLSVAMTLSVMPACLDAEPGASVGDVTGASTTDTATTTTTAHSTATTDATTTSAATDASSPDTTTTTSVEPDTSEPECIEGESRCFSDAECCAGACSYDGMSYAEGRCFAPQSAGAACQRDAWCASGRCVEGLCGE